MKMKKNRIAAALGVLYCVTSVFSAVPAYADSQKVVTLGADLSEEQKQAILRYFGVAGQNLETLTITNQDERNHLASYVPLEQIGTHTYSCALVSPTNSGGIQVKTANLTWVTSNMIASTLSTSGVVNCDVLAASPFPVSGTGALTGIMMAYESAVGEELDPAKKEIATQEMVTTTTIAGNIGQQQATQIVNEAKMQVIQGENVTVNDIDVIINQVADDKDVELSEDDHDMLSDLLEEIALEDYEYDDMRETLERVDDNMSDEETADPEYAEDGGEEASMEADEEDYGEEEDIPEEDSKGEASLAEDSILMNTDDSALGDAVVFDATDDAALSDSLTGSAMEALEGAMTPEDGFDITVSDDYSSDGDGEAAAEAEEGGSSEEGDAPDTDAAEADDSGMEADGSADEADLSGMEENILDGMEQDGFSDDADLSGMEQDGSGDEADLSGMEEDVPDGMEEDGSGMEEDGSSMELIPLSDLVLSPMTSDATTYQVYPAGLQELTVYYQRGDLIPGSGTLTLYNAADSSMVETVYMSDSAKVSTGTIDAEELSELGWADGYKTVISLEKPLAQDTTYFVALSQDAFATSDGTGSSEATPDSYSWTIQTAPYGFYIDQSAGSFQTGATASGQLLMDGSNAVYADLEGVDTSIVTFDQYEFTATGTLNATFLSAGVTTFQVAFYDAYSNLIDTIQYTIEVQ